MNADLAAAPRLDRPREVLPTRRAALTFRAKAACFQLRRWLSDFWSGPSRHRVGQALAEAAIGGAHESDLWTEAAVPAERNLQLGKVQNLRTAARALDGLEIPPGAVWSFWRQVGRPIASRGYAVGRELRDGCLIPTVGGGLCQLSGAIYNAALQAGLEVVERHRHTHPGVGSLAALGRDATIFWNYVDLRLRAPFAWRLEVHLTASRLGVRIRQPGISSAASAGITSSHRTAVPEPGSCASCGVAQCFRHQQSGASSAPHTAWLVDEYWPEWRGLLEPDQDRPALLIRPLDGRRWRRPSYAWPASSFVATKDLTWTTLRRAWATRRLREQGAARQRALLAWDERLARAAAARLHPAQAHLVVAQNLLPFLWRDGVLGGRTFDVLMTRLPLAALEAALDEAAALHPESPTCADFRAPADLVEAEAEALAGATSWITPHRGIAALAGPRARLLAWDLPKAPSRAADICPRRIVFAASTLGRKGAYEVRAVARELGLAVTCLGGTELEAPGFWQEVQLVPPSPTSWLDGAAAVLLPAFVEHRPRRLLAAVAAGVPVIASTACGLGELPGVTEVSPGDPTALAAAVRALGL